MIVFAEDQHPLDNGLVPGTGQLAGCTLNDNAKADEICKRTMALGHGLDNGNKHHILWDVCAVAEPPTAQPGLRKNKKKTENVLEDPS